MRFLWNLFLMWLAGKLTGKKRRAAEKAAYHGAPVGRTLDAAPDGPLPFGYKTAWLAVRCPDPERVAAALGYLNSAAANWTTGLRTACEAPGCVFISPCLDGFVLVIGRAMFDLGEDTLESLAARFPEVQYFASHRVSDGYV